MWTVSTTRTPFSAVGEDISPTSRMTRAHACFVRRPVTWRNCFPVHGSLARRQCYVPCRSSSESEHAGCPGCIEKGTRLSLMRGVLISSGHTCGDRASEGQVDMSRTSSIRQTHSALRVGGRQLGSVIPGIAASNTLDPLPVGCTSARPERPPVFSIS
jgi:hypothetical protein